MSRRSHYNPTKDIDPDEIFLDDKNIPEFDVHQFEGRMSTPIKRSTILILGAAFFFLGSIFLTRAAVLEVVDGKQYATKSEQNRLEHQLLFPERGIITDRYGKQLAWNVPSTEELGFYLRQYTDTPGFGNILGYLHYPARDKHGVYYRKDYEADSGIEEFYNDALKGKINRTGGSLPTFILACMSRPPMTASIRPNDATAICCAGFQLMSIPTEESAPDALTALLCLTAYLTAYSGQSVTRQDTL